MLPKKVVAFTRAKNSRVAGASALPKAGPSVLAFATEHRQSEGDARRHAETRAAGLKLHNRAFFLLLERQSRIRSSAYGEG